MQVRPWYTALLLVLISTLAIAQKYDPLSSPDSYRAKSNPHYWKNKMPFEGYWQQDVHYKIKAVINDSSDILHATEQLTYWNNSPDDIDFVFFHLYQNAFQPGSYYDNLRENNGKHDYYGKYERDGLGTIIEHMTVDGKEVETTPDNTILKVFLNETLKSGEKITIDIEFSTYFDHRDVRRRMKIYDTFGNKHFDGVHWYPRISVYDRKFGWTTDQHFPISSATSLGTMRWSQ